MKRTTTILLAILATLTATPTAAQANQRDMLVVAHAANTLAAVHSDHVRRADVVENDVQRTKDGRLIVLHDRSLAAMTNVEDVYPDRAPWLLEDFTLREVRRLTVSSTGERLPTLVEWARAVGDQRMLVEVKTPGYYPNMAGTMIRELTTYPVLRRSALEGRLAVQSFSHSWLYRFAKRSPVDVPVGALWAYTPSPEQVAAQAAWADQVNPVYFAVTPDFMAQARALGLEVYAWTVTAAADMRRMSDLGVDGVITDRPVRLLRTVR